MYDAVYKFRRYEDTSLVYTGINKHEGEKVGLYDTSLSNYDYLYAKQQESMVAPDGSALGNGAKAETSSPAPTVKPSVKPLISGVSRSIENAKTLGKTPVKEDRIIDVLESHGARIADRRPKGGSLWAIGGGELDVVMSELAENGAQFTYKLEGGKATGFKAGWWLSGYPKKSEPQGIGTRRTNHHRGGPFQDRGGNSGLPQELRLRRGCLNRQRQNCRALRQR